MGIQPVPVRFDVVEDGGDVVDKVQRTIEHKILAAAREFIKHDLEEKRGNISVSVHLEGGGHACSSG
jgi:hypothetical protein